MMPYRNEAERWPVHATIHLPQSAGLARLLRGLPWCERAGLASAAEPGNGAQSTVTVLQHHIGAVGDELAGALVRAREVGAEGADELAGVAGQFGIREVTPEPAPVAPEPAPVPTLSSPAL